MKNWKIVFWAVLFIISLIGFVITITTGRTVAYISTFIAVLFTAWWLIVEIRKAKKK
ncbi:MAG: hypothetical protein MJ077_03705 [Oscillospiraceae bacterium]|nr:hypothetical protein [Oscillospiraceae bacterium]